MALFEDLIFCYPFNGNSNDVQGGHDGSDTSISYSAGKVGDCAVFNGSSSEIIVGSVPEIDALDTFTLAFWIYIDSYPSGTLAQIARYSKTGAIYFEICLDDDDLNCYINTGFGSARYYDLSNFPTGQWVHVVRQCIDGYFGQTLYVNGSAVSSHIGGYTGRPSSVPGLTFGSADGEQYFDGKLDQVCLWNRALTTGEISALYNSGSGLAWPFGGMQAGTFETTETLVGGGYPNPLPVGALETSESLSGAPCSRLAQLLYLAYDGTISKVVDGSGPYASWQKSNNDYEYYASSYSMASDTSGNLYGIFADFGIWYVSKISPAGVLQWAFEVTSGIPLGVTCDPDGDYVYVSNNYVSARITKIDGATGVEVTGGGWPVTSSIIGYTTFKKLKYGRDGKIYAAANSSSTYGGRLYKIEPADGSRDWYVTFTNLLGDPIIVNDFDINASGSIAVGCLDNEVGHGLWKLTSTGAKSWSHNPNTSDASNYGEEVISVAIDDDGYVYYSSYEYSLTAKLSPDGSTEQWSVSGYGYIYLTAEDTYLYRLGSSSTSGHTDKLFSSTGVQLAQWDYFSHIALSGAEIPAWDIMPTIGANGSITSNVGFALTSGTPFAVAVDDSVTLSVDGDTGYAPASILINSVEQL